MLPRSGITPSILNLFQRKAGGILSGLLADAINSSFGSFDSFKDQFNKAAATSFRIRMGMAGKKWKRSACRLSRNQMQAILFARVLNASYDV